MTPESQDLLLNLGLKSGRDALPEDFADEAGFGPAFRRRGDDMEVRRRLPLPRMDPAGPIQPILGNGPSVEETTQEPESSRQSALHSWLRGTYRPRGLTLAGILALRRLGENGGILRAYPRAPLESLEERRDVLAMRYTAWDLIRRGHVAETMGAYYRPLRESDRQELSVWERLGLLGSHSHMGEHDLLIWLAISRMMTLDQFITLDPENARNNVELLLELRARKVVASRRIPLGEGNIEIWELAPRGWRFLNQHHLDLRSRGFGPRRKISRHEDRIITSRSTGSYALHQLFQADAITWFTHHFEAHGAHVTNIWLERTLAAEGGNAKGGRMLDFRLQAEDRNLARISVDIEVIGVGHSYRENSKKKFIHGSPAHMSFSGASSHVSLGHHVCIGR